MTTAYLKTLPTVVAETNRTAMDLYLSLKKNRVHVDSRGLEQFMSSHAFSVSSGTYAFASIPWKDIDENPAMSEDITSILAEAQRLKMPLLPREAALLLVEDLMKSDCRITRAESWRIIVQATDPSPSHPYDIISVEWPDESMWDCEIRIFCKVAPAEATLRHINLRDADYLFGPPTLSMPDQT